MIEHQMQKPQAPSKTRPKLKCRAKSKSTGVQCTAWAIWGKTLCYHHGGKTEKVPALQAMKHGQTSKFYSEAEVDKLLRYRRELDTLEGQAEALKDNYAKIKVREERIPESVDFTEVAIKAAESKRKDVLAIHEITQEEKPDAPTTFVIGNFDPSQGAPFQGRTIDGPCTVRYLEGAPFMFEPTSGGWMPCSEQVDDESGAKYFVKILAG